MGREPNLLYRLLKRSKKNYLPFLFFSLKLNNFQYWGLIVSLNWAVKTLMKFLLLWVVQLCDHLQKLDLITKYCTSSSLHFNPKTCKKGCANILQFQRFKLISFSYLLFPRIHNINHKARQAEKPRMLVQHKYSQLQASWSEHRNCLSGYTVTVTP